MLGLLKSKYGIRCPRDTIMKKLKELDPEATEQRKSRVLKRREYISRGPNDTWHADGYDKLKPYGLPIHGAIDGFSRKILWLKVCKSNNNPVIPASFYLKTVEEQNLCPRKFRTDAGTENVIAAALHCTIHGDINAHRFGSSITNQRIENWWSSLRRRYSGWVIDFFKKKVDYGTFITGCQIHKEVSWFAFSRLLQKDLDIIVKDWNTHYIRKSRAVVSGIPNVLYNLPQSYGFQKNGIPITQNDLIAIEGVDRITNDALVANSSNSESENYFKYVVVSKNLTWPPNTWEEGELIFDTLISLCI